MLARKPVVAGQFYSENSGSLKKQIESLLEKKTTQQDALGVVLPHAGYMYSARVALAVVSRLKNFDIYVIMGPNHSGSGPAISVFNGDLWQSPLGEVKVDKELVKEI